MIQSPSNDVLAKVESLAREVILREGCEFYDVELTSSSGQRVLRIYIDKLNVPVSVDDCANVSRGLNLLLDGDDVIPGGAYNLEVSSPGLERNLKRKEHFQRALGQKIWIKLNKNLQDLGLSDKALITAKQVQGVLNQVDDVKGIQLQVIESIEKSIQESVLDIPWENIEKAKLVFEFGQEKRGK